jgi:hypothetical protein
MDFFCPRELTVNRLVRKMINKTADIRGLA